MRRADAPPAVGRGIPRRRRTVPRAHAAPGAGWTAAGRKGAPARRRHATWRCRRVLSSRRPAASRGARLIAATHTAPRYRLVALPDGRPGLERLAHGAAIAVEVWSMPIEQLGSFVAAIPPPLAIGTVLLADGSACKGFLCESVAAAAAVDITGYGGWRAYLAAQ